MKKLFFTLLFVGLTLKAKSQTKIDTFAQKWIGVPYTWGGLDSTGIDCSGLIKKFSLSIFGQDIPRTTREQMKVVKKISIDSIKEGDLIFFKSKRSPSGYHVGVYLHDGLFLHAASKKLGVIVSSFEHNKTVLMIGRIIKQNINAYTN
jgi:cell wall-associated NlpC family hydrolase